MNWPFHKELEVLSFSGEEEVISRLRELGFREGMQLKIIGRAPFYGPFLIRLGTMTIALREQELQCLKLSR